MAGVALRAGLAAAVAEGFNDGAAAASARVRDGCAACMVGLALGTSIASEFCDTLGLLVACRATLDELGRICAATADASGAADGASVAAISVAVGAA